MEKVKKSDTWLRARTGFVRASLLLLWAESWEQTPCGSLPNDDELLSLLLDMDASLFAQHKAVLMRGWVLADDGRLYHETITERVLAMIDKRMSDAQRAAKSRAAKANAAPTPNEVTDASRVTDEGLHSEFNTRTRTRTSNTEEPNGSRRQADQQLPNCPHDDIVRLYHEALPELPAVKVMSDSRQKAMRGFWRWVLTSKKSDGSPRAQTADQALTWIGNYFERAKANDFLMGRRSAGQGHDNWRCDFDFLLTEKGKRHVIEKTADTA
ncbi:hypothetical protein [Brevundimonas sp.]|uniref:hypothetical protein n=1 Tax=Brevundimonas sp. TaxID=1871086 RepID=UPI003783698C